MIENSVVNVDLDDTPDFQLVDILTQIEKENKPLYVNNTKTAATVDTNNQGISNKSTNQITTTTAKTINISNVSNVMNRTQFVPSMYFPHSNVTINYHFNN